MFALPGMRIGRSGVERAQEEALRGRAGAVQLEVNAVGRVIRELERREGIPGDDVTLSIDADWQWSVLKRLGDESASAVLRDCQVCASAALAGSARRRRRCARPTPE